ncbi:MAG TPA: helix-turn-helix domain-containing protein [Sphingomicrobium sp.]|nr:helix-turn-helix domain-containing protein [Sphingomicrobium sp.]
MSQIQRQSITKEQWDEATASYELGYQNGAQIARELGVSPATVSRELKRRGARKGCRVDEVVAELVARLDAEAKDKARREEAEAAARGAVMDALVGELMDALIAADKAGQLASANEEVVRIGKALSLAMR